MNHLGSLYRDWGYYSDAEETHLQALAMVKDVYGADHIGTVELYALGQLYRHEQRFDEAAEVYSRGAGTFASRMERLGQTQQTQGHR